MSTALLILLAEDDPGLRTILDEGLCDAGFALVVKANGTAAIAELEANAGAFHAVVTDIRLGEGPSGWDVGRCAREQIPTMPVVYMSGDSAADWSSQGVPDSVMIQKPFVIAQVVTAVATLLNKDAV
jgi:DNA-binding NtrC family response regulator